MKQVNIVKNLRKKGYDVEWGKFSYWDNVPFANKTAIAQRYCVNGTQGIRTDFRLSDVLEAIERGFESVGDYLEYKENL